MDIYIVYMSTEFGEEVEVCVEASSPSEAEAIGMAKLENGELGCDGLICLNCTAVLAN